jgi:hypothetical protein
MNGQGTERSMMRKGYRFSIPADKSRRLKWLLGK